MIVVVAYDIASPARLRKVARLMKSFGLRVQRSVFECDLSQAHLAEMTRLLRLAINSKHDRVHIYRICESCRSRFATLGAQDCPVDEGDLWII